MDCSRSLGHIAVTMVAPENTILAKLLVPLLEIIVACLQGVPDEGPYRIVTTPINSVGLPVNVPRILCGSVIVASASVNVVQTGLT